MPHVPLLAVTRGPLREVVHWGSIAVVDAGGRALAVVGEDSEPQFARSTLKPWQALGLVREGGMERFGFDSQDLALFCASHAGEDIHTRGVARILGRIGASPADLRCGCGEPLFYASTHGSPPAGARWTPLHHNCSGKHSGFLAWSRMLGEPLDRYLDPEGRVQRRVRAIVREFALGDRTAEGTDGCSAPNFAMPLPRIAHLYARLAADPGPGLRALFFAMTRHPDLVSGTGRFDLALARAGGGDWVGKVGADGMQCVGVRSRGIGIAVRVADGSARAVQVAAVEVLHRLGLLEDPGKSALAPWFRPVLRNAAGLPTGGTEPLFAPIARLT